MRPTGLSLSLLLLACNPQPRSDATVAPAAVTSATLAFEDVQVFDGQQWLDGVTVLVDDATIVAVGPDLPVPEGAERIDTAGATLLPGLIDAHTHVQAASQLQRALSFGVTTEIDMFTTAQLAASLRAPASDHGRADLVSAGVLATAPGGHGTEYGIAIPTLSSPEQAAAFVDARLAEGSDFIKIVYDDGHGFGGEIPTIDEPTLRALIEAAHARDVLAVVHISAQDDALTAIEAGADGLAHLFLDQPPSAAFVSAAKEHDIFVTDTLPVLSALCDGSGGGALAEDPRLRPLLLPQERAALTKGFGRTMDLPCDNALSAAKQLHEAGVRLLASTDTPNPGTVHGASVHHELALLVEAGLDPAAALRAATADPADVFGLADRGRIAAGMQADLLLVGGDPSVDITATRDIRGVWKAGTAFDLQGAREQVARSDEELDRAKNAPSPAGLAAGLISDFESGEPRSEFGAGWQKSTDQMRGGTSTVELDVVDEGPDGSPLALRIRGTIDEGSLPNAWAGAMFFPGDQAMRPANLSRTPTLSFAARGDGPLMVMVFASQLGFMPAMTSVEIGPEWSRHEVDLRSLVTEPYDVTGIYFGVPAKAGSWTVLLDDVRLK